MSEPTGERERAEAAFWREREAGCVGGDRGGYAHRGFIDGYLAACAELTPATPDAGDANEPLEFIRRLVGAWDCCGTCAGGVLAQRDRAREAAAATRARAEALREAADEASSVGHHWSGAPAHAFFGLAEDLRDRADSIAPDAAGDTPARTKPTTASLLADLAATREADQGAREKRAIGGAA